MISDNEIMTLTGWKAALLIFLAAGAAVLGWAIFEGWRPWEYTPGYLWHELMGWLGLTT